MSRAYSIAALNVLVVLACSAENSGNSGTGEISQAPANSVMGRVRNTLDQGSANVISAD